MLNPLFVFFLASGTWASAVVLGSLIEAELEGRKLKLEGYETPMPLTAWLFAGITSFALGWLGFILFPFIWRVS